MDKLAIYVHWPFCKSKCPYCDFNSHVRSNIDAEAFLNAYLKEINYFSNYLHGKTITSIFFGGGTPSLMPVSLVEAILIHLAKQASISENCEITLEANPTSSEAKKFRQLKEIGVNRLSIGVQSLNDSELKFLGREHSSAEALKVLDLASTIFDNYSCDLIYALPNQNTHKWEELLKTILQFTSKHISLYQLTIEKGTAFYRDYRNNKFSLPKEKQAAKLYELTIKTLEERNFINYEISNFAKPGFESAHNLSYWLYQPYLGLGAGAHSRLHYKDGSIKAVMMTHSPENWLQQIWENNNAVQNSEALSPKQIAIEKLIMGLRLSEGIDITDLMEFIDKSNLENNLNLNLLELHNNKLRPTNKGKLLLNSIVSSLFN